MKYLILIFCFAFSLFSNATVRTTRFTLGHHDVREVELKQLTDKKENTYSIHTYRNSQQTAARVLTEKTYKQILKDWNFNIPVTKVERPCATPMAITKTIDDGKVFELNCPSNWSKDQILRFNSFQSKLNDLATGKLAFYK